MVVANTRESDQHRAPLGPQADSAATAGQAKTRRGVAVPVGIGAVLLGCAITLIVANFHLGTNPASATMPSSRPAEPATELSALRDENARLRHETQELLARAAQLQAASRQQAVHIEQIKRGADQHASQPSSNGTAKSSATWTLMFRSDNPALWDTDLNAGDTFAAPLNWAPANMRYLRLSRLDTGEALIIPLTRAQLRNQRVPSSEEPIRWSGTAKKEWEGAHLGIAEMPRYHFPVPRGMICVMMDGWDAFAGSGFGHKAFVNDKQYYSWRGQEIPRTVFEIAVSPGPLGPDDEACLRTEP